MGSVIKNMATGSLLRVAGRFSLSKVGGNCLFRHVEPATSGALILKKDFSSSPVNAGRVYGPLEGGKPETSHWLNERYLSAALFPIIGVGLAFPHPVTDTVLCASLVLHSHWHMEGVFTDYIHGPTLPKLIKPFMLTLSILAFGSLCYINYFDVGFANTVRMLYTKL